MHGFKSVWTLYSEKVVSLLPAEAACHEGVPPQVIQLDQLGAQLFNTGGDTYSVFSTLHQLSLCGYQLLLSGIQNARF